MTTRRVLLIAVGRASRGDEGLGAALLGRCRELPIAGRWWLTLVGDAQLQIEHALDLQINDLALFIEANAKARAPFEFHAVTRPPGHRILPMGDSLSPSDVLHTLSTIGRREALPATYRLSIRGEEFADEPGLSAAASSHLDAATEFVMGLLEDPDPERWDRYAGVETGEAVAAGDL